MKLFFSAIYLAFLVSACRTAVPAKKQTTGTFEIIHTNFLGCLWSEAYARASIVSQDGGESFVVPGGAVWAFGDTFRGSRLADGMPRFAGGAFSPAIAFLAIDAVRYPPAFNFLVFSNSGIPALDFLPEERPTERYRIWPLGGIYLRGRAYLYYSLIEVFGTGVWDFRCIGSGLSRATASALGTYERLTPRGNWRYPVAPTQVLEAEGWLYLFSIEIVNGQSEARLARVRPEKIEDPSAYEFYAGRGPRFSTNPADATCLVQNIPGQVSVAWNSYWRKYVMASSSDINNPREIRLLVADNPCGPWSEPVARIEVPEKRQGKQVDMVYCAYLHPELFRENGRIMNLTYSLGLKNAGFDANCEMVEIELKRSP